MGWVADLDGRNAEEAYWRADESVPIDDMTNLRDFLVAMLLFTKEDLRAISNLRRARAGMNRYPRGRIYRSVERCLVALARVSGIGYEAFWCACDRQRAENSALIPYRQQSQYRSVDSLLAHSKAYAIMDDLQAQALRQTSSTTYRDSELFKGLPWQGYEIARIVRKGVEFSRVVDRSIAEQDPSKKQSKGLLDKCTGSAKYQASGSKASRKTEQDGKRKRQACPCCSHDYDDPKSLRDHLRSSPDCHRYCGPHHDPDSQEEVIEDCCPGSNKNTCGESDTDDDEEVLDKGKSSTIKTEIKREIKREIKDEIKDETKGETKDEFSNGDEEYIGSASIMPHPKYISDDSDKENFGRPRRSTAKYKLDDEIEGLLADE